MIALHFYRAHLLTRVVGADILREVTVASSILSLALPLDGSVRHEPERNPIPKVVWLFGRSGSGKTTLATRLTERFHAAGTFTVHLDGTAIRARLSSDLGFSARDRAENHRRIAEIAYLLVTQGITVVVSSMAPMKLHRDAVRAVLEDSVTWVHLDASVETCTERDPKRLYQRAREGRVPDFLDFPFEAPDADETVWHHCTEGTSPEASLRRIWILLNSRTG